MCGCMGSVLLVEQGQPQSGIQKGARVEKINIYSELISTTKPIEAGVPPVGPEATPSQVN